MLCAWVAIDLYLSQEHQRVFPILLLSSSESDDSLCGQFPLTDFFLNKGFLDVRLQICKVKVIAQHLKFHVSNS